MKDAKIVGLGEALWDMLPQGKQLGGAPANFAYHVAQMGLQGVAVSALGSDMLGDEIESTLRRRGLSHYMPRVDKPTGTVQVTLDAQGIPQYDICEDVAWDHIPFTPQLAALAAQTRAVCFGSLAQRSQVSRTTIQQFLQAMPHDDGVWRIFDINLRQQFYSVDIIRRSLVHCNVLKINDEELEVVSRLLDLPGATPADKCRIMVARYELRMLILTCGTAGSYVFVPGRMSFLPTPVVEVADTVGAGDAFAAAFCACMLQGATVEQAHQRAVDVSAYVCTQAGAMPILPAQLRTGLGN